MSDITDIFGLFKNTKFNGDISEWNVFNVRNAMCMFFNSEYDKDFSTWYFANVKYYSGMFKYSPLENQFEKQPKFKKQL